MYIRFFCTLVRSLFFPLFRLFAFSRAFCDQFSHITHNQIITQHLHAVFSLVKYDEENTLDKLQAVFDYTKTSFCYWKFTQSLFYLISLFSFILSSLLLPFNLLIDTLSEYKWVTRTISNWILFRCISYNKRVYDICIRIPLKTEYFTQFVWLEMIIKWHSISLRLCHYILKCTVERSSYTFWAKLTHNSIR